MLIEISSIFYWHIKHQNNMVLVAYALDSFNCMVRQKGFTEVDKLAGFLVILDCTIMYLF